MKIFQLNADEWWLGRNLQDAISCAIETTGVSRDDLLDESCHELTDDELDTLIFTDSDPDAETPAEGWPQRTFREELARRLAEGPEDYKAEPFAFSGDY